MNANLGFQLSSAGFSSFLDLDFVVFEAEE